MKHQLHMIAHEIRDQYVRANLDAETVDVREISNLLCDMIMRYFSILIPGHRIGVAVRVASRVGDKVGFVTAGRAGLEPKREATTEPLYEDEGIARVFRDERGRRGVLLINDIAGAAKIGAFRLQDNDGLFPDDYRTMMIGPINGWDGKGEGTIGILYVTSRSVNVFYKKHVDSMGFVCDSLANVYSEIAKSQLTGDPSAPFRFRR